jgi:hypothetical protein
MDFIISCFNHPIINDINDNNDKKDFIDTLIEQHNLTFDQLKNFCTDKIINDENFINIVNMVECWQFKYKHDFVNQMNFDLFNKYFDILPYDFKNDIFDNNEKYQKYCPYLL